MMMTTMTMSLKPTTCGLINHQIMLLDSNLTTVDSMISLTLAIRIMISIKCLMISFK